MKFLPGYTDFQRRVPQVRQGAFQGWKLLKLWPCSLQFLTQSLVFAPAAATVKQV